MREQWARNIALLTGLLVVLLAIMFAKIQNPEQPPYDTTADSVEISPKIDVEQQTMLATGRIIFDTQGCARCHSIAGVGNPRYPLDDVGKRRTPETIRQWILAPTEIKDQLPAGAFQIKQTYRNQRPEDIDALVAYLQSL